MAKEYVLTLTAANRIGILAAVSNAIAELGGDVREISVTVMRKFFTIILSADFPEHRRPNVIIDHLQDIGRPYGMTVILNDPNDPELPREAVQNYRTFYLSLSGKNQPGTMRRIASRLTQEGVDISDLYAVREDETGTFRMLLQLAVPDNVEPSALAGALEMLNDETNISALLQTADDFRQTGSPLGLRTLL